MSQIDRRLSQADLGRTAVQAVAGARGFRNYNWLTNVAATNAAGNFRGMVVSAKWHVAFRHVSQIGEYLENVGLFAGFVASILEAEPQLSAVLDSDDSAGLKGARMIAIAGTAAQRTLLGVIPAGTHAIYLSLEGWCMMAGLAGGKFQSGVSQCISTLQRADTLVQSTYKTVTDTQNQSQLVHDPGRAASIIWWVIDTAFTAR